MAMDRILERLAKGTPLRVGELSRMSGYSDEKLRGLAEEGRIATVSLGIEQRYPVAEAQRLLESIGVLGK